MHPLFTTADGNTYDPYRPANGAPLPAATFIVKFHPMRGFYLDKIENLQTRPTSTARTTPTASCRPTWTGSRRGPPPASG